MQCFIQMKLIRFFNDSVSDKNHFESLRDSSSFIKFIYLLFFGTKIYSNLQFLNKIIATYYLSP